MLTAALLTGIPAGAALTDATVKSYEQQLAELQAKQAEALAKLDTVRDDYSDVMLAKAGYDELVALSIKKSISSTLRNPSSRLPSIHKMLPCQLAFCRNSTRTVKVAKSP